MKKPGLIIAKYCLRGLAVSSAISLLAFSGCSSIDGGATSPGAPANLLMGHTEHAQEKSGSQPVSTDPGYKWFY